MSGDYELQDINHHNEPSTSSSESSNTFEAINNFAYNNVRESFLPKSTSEEQPVNYQHYPKPLTRKSLYLVTLGVVVVWFTGLIIYAQHPRAFKTDDAYQNYNTTAAYGLPHGGSEVKPGEKIPLSLKAVRLDNFRVWQTSFDFLMPPSSDSVDTGIYHEVGRVKSLLDSKLDKAILPGKIVYKKNTYVISQTIPNYQLDTVIILTNQELQWRRSKYFNAFVYYPDSKKVEPLYVTEDGNLPRISWAGWSPQYSAISFVYSNNIYLWQKDQPVKQVTNDGDVDIFNGKPDWVYEEEVSESDRLLWWAPDDLKFAYLKINDTDVPVYDVDFYTKDMDYPTHTYIKYPKPGFPDPQVNVLVYTLANGNTNEVSHTDSTLGRDFIVYDAFWLNKDKFFIKETDRISRVLHYRVWDGETSTVVREVNYQKQFGGWVDKTNVLVIGKNPEKSRPLDGYIDLVVDGNGFEHLGYFKDTESEPVVLTTGDYDDLTDSLAFDYGKNLVYFTAARQSSMSRHIFSVDLATQHVKPITDDSKMAYYEAEFSSGARYLSLKYMGPELPTQKLIDLHEPLNIEAEENLVSSDKATAALQKYQVPTRRRFEVDVKGKVKVNVVEIRPENFDANRNYPVLVNFYGGPGSQRADAKFDINVNDAVVSSLDAIVLIIDPRGTGYKGWSFKSWVRDMIGEWEPKDIIEATKWYIANHKVDQESVACWGWSYSGYLALRVLEIDTEQIFKYGISVAPVTNWRLYNTFYTERYLGLPLVNGKSYDRLAIGGTNIENFKNKNRFLIMHGSADDNVHIQNTLQLVDKFNLAGIENYDMKIYPDSDHNIYYHNANAILYDKLFDWINDAFSGVLNQLTS